MSEQIVREASAWQETIEAIIENQPEFFTGLAQSVHSPTSRFAFVKLLARLPQN